MSNHEMYYNMETYEMINPEETSFYQPAKVAQQVYDPFGIDQRHLCQFNMTRIDDFREVVRLSTAERLAKYPEMRMVKPKKRVPRVKAPVKKIPEFSCDEVEKEVEVEAEPEKPMWANSNDLRMLFTCGVCQQCYSTNIALKNHQKEHYLVDFKPKTLNYKCPYTDCETRCDCQRAVVEHVRNAHQRTDIEVETLKFQNLDAFYGWKQMLEETTNTRYVKVSASRNSDVKTSRFICQFGKPIYQKQQQEPIDRIRYRTSKRTGKSCTAYMVVREDGRIGNEVTMSGCLKHLGHVIRPQDVPLSHSLKQEIRQRLLDGWDEHKIFVHIRDGSNENSRRHYITLKDIRNIHAKLVHEIEQKGLTIDEKDVKEEIIEDEEYNSSQ